MSASESDETPLFIEFKCFRCGDDQKIHVDKLCNVCVSYNETIEHIACERCGGKTIVDGMADLSTCNSCSKQTCQYHTLQYRGFTFCPPQVGCALFLRHAHDCFKMKNCFFCGEFDEEQRRRRHIVAAKVAARNPVSAVIDAGFTTTTTTVTPAKRHNASNKP